MNVVTKSGSSSVPFMFSVTPFAFSVIVTWLALLTERIVSDGSDAKLTADGLADDINDVTAKAADRVMILYGFMTERRVDYMLRVIPNDSVLNCGPH